MIKIGTDVVQITRIERIFSKFGEKFCKRILHPLEIDLSKQLTIKRSNYLAKRFASKEAISKAFGVGIGSLLIFSDILISKDKLGAPKVIVEQKALNRILPVGFSSCEIALSISDDHPIVVAFAMITFVK
jgi:holo-[acyl-carrier protein] synthase